MKFLECLKAVVGLVLMALLGACASAIPSPNSIPLADQTISALEIMPWGQPQTWQAMSFPGKRVTQYRSEIRSGRPAVHALADRSASMLRQKISIEPEQLGRLKFSWKVNALMEQADMALRDLDDSPVRIVLTFEGDRTKFSAKNQILSELSHSLTGEPMPYATLMYVWCKTRPVGSVILNPRTDRIRKLVVQSGAERTGAWLDYERHVRTDFEKAFGEAPGRLTGIALMTDSDNTQSLAQAWYGSVQWLAKQEISSP